MALKIVVLAKQVPDTRNVGKDAMTAEGTVNRAALPAIFNPEDLNALEQALRLKEQNPGSTVGILTMGPPRAGEIIRQGLYRGADTGWLLTDRLFAGADTLATSYALATAIKKIGDVDIVIGGRQAIDGDTAQVGPQVAQKLGLNQVTYAEEVLSVEGGFATIKRVIDGGVETVKAPLPVVITVNGSAAPCRPQNAKLVMKYKRATCPMERPAEGTPYDNLYEERPYLTLNQWSVADVDGDANQCGLSGSPTKVKAIKNIVFQAKESKTLTASDADIEGMIKELLRDMNNVFVYCEIEGTQVQEVSQELLTKGRKLANELKVELHAVVAGTGIKGKVEDQILPYGVDKLFVFDAKDLFPYTSAPHTDILVNLFKEEQPQICLMGATVIGRDLGPRVSSSLTSGLTADCTELEIGDFEDKKSGKLFSNLLYQIRPAFGGNIVATIVNPEHRPQMATVRSGVMQKAIYDGACKKEVVYPEVSKYVSPEAFVVKVLDHHVEAAKHNLKGAPIVVAGGYGMGSKENFDMLFQLAKVLHGEVGGSRAAVDAGWLDHDRQIGQTGVTVHPKVYIACGISGQIQHIAGMQDSGIIISVNSDPDAPINKIADYVIVGTVEEVVPKLIKYYKQNSK